jgi:hypothetical protein
MFDVKRPCRVVSILGLHRRELLEGGAVE